MRSGWARWATPVKSAAVLSRWKWEWELVARQRRFVTCLKMRNSVSTLGLRWQPAVKHSLPSLSPPPPPLLLLLLFSLLRSWPCEIGRAHV